MTWPSSRRAATSRSSSPSCSTTTTSASLASPASATRRTSTPPTSSRPRRRTTRTKVIAVYCEDFRDGRRFAQAALDARTAGKPVVLLTVGASEASARQASSHTASLVSSSDVVDAACAAGGIVRVHTPSQMADAVALLRESPQARGRTGRDHHRRGRPRVDRRRRRRVARPRRRALQRASWHATVAAELPAAATSVNPIDVAGGGEQDLSCFGRVVRSVLASGEVDAMVVSGYFGGYGQYGEALGRARGRDGRRDGRRGRRVGPSAGRALDVPGRAPPPQSCARAGVPVYRTIEGALRCARRRPQVSTRRGWRRFPTPSAPLGRPRLLGRSEPRCSTPGCAFPTAHLVASADELEAVAARPRVPGRAEGNGVAAQDRRRAASGSASPTPMSCVRSTARWWSGSARPR